MKKSPPGAIIGAAYVIGHESPHVVTGSPRMRGDFLRAERPSGLFLGRSRSRRHEGFSLTELVVVLGITALLAAMIMPALRGVQQTAKRLVCSSNMRQIGIALNMHGDDKAGRLPFSHFCSLDLDNIQRR